MFDCILRGVLQNTVATYYGNNCFKESQEQKEEPEKDENGYYIGQKCRCRWKSMNGAYYNCEIRERNETAPTLTYAIDYADGDKEFEIY